MEVAESPIQRIDQYGASRLAYQISYVLQSARHSQPVQAWDEWIDATTGRVIGSDLRAREQGLHDIHFTTRPTNDDRPGMFGLTHLAGLRFRSGDEITWPLRAERPVPSSPTSDGQLIVNVDSIGGTAGACLAAVRMTANWSTLDYLRGAVPGYTVESTLREQTPFPSEIVVWHASPVNGSRQEAFRLQLNSSQNGDGPPLPRSTDSTSQPLIPEETASGFPAETDCTFRSCLDEALKIVRQHPMAILYFSQRPQATPAFLQHRNAVESSPYSDGWDLEWDDGSSRLQAQVLFSKRSSLEDGVLVYSTDDTAGGAANLTGPMISLSAMASSFQEAFAAAPEVLFCDFREEWCALNTHRGSDHGPIGGEPAEPDLGSRIGMLFGLKTGLIHQIDSSDPRYLGPSALAV